ncbi:sirohydrochlorin chelatase [Rhodoferax sp. PAMC 29310]|uniref:sirohydrochlorin chelatase n=1 Tax=Rhodoferax sp. PAMC 29310 TaxID=2822760 RepID=UPI001B335C12|nr:CbiX/SirB N-terminal domain-containing protein [Rhodoferax sp. PAMC 29310]
MSDPMTRATILFAHGSRDPLWRLPIEAVATHMRQTTPSCQVRCAYLELTQPDIATSAAELVALGTKTISVLPLFLGVGRHAREDLPVLMIELKQRFPHVNFELRPAVGEDPRVVELLAHIALN